jgi:hypothetical protein
VGREIGHHQFALRFGYGLVRFEHTADPSAENVGGFAKSRRPSSLTVNVSPDVSVVMFIK